MSSFQLHLLTWYKNHRRDLPWRRVRDPYRILLSEVMLQQTQVRTVIPYYHRFLKNFPSFRALAKAPLSKVLKQWEGLGYYSRARHLCALAKRVTRDFHGRLPSDPGALRRLPGIGRYTAGAVASIAFGLDTPVVDGNVQRVLARYYGWPQDLRSPSMQRRLWELAERLLPKGQAGDYNQALMDLGASLCLPRNPRCGDCPIRLRCRARLENRTNQIPFKRRRKPVPHVQIGAGVIWKGDKILISQRPLKGLLGGLWEFPGGKQEAGESLPTCVRREIQEELGIQVKVGSKLGAVDHAYSHFTITLHAYHCEYISGSPRALGCRAWRWATPLQLKSFAFPAANQPFIRQLLENPSKK